ncbi:hypothetical protein HDU82_005120 [Entophlyctis luteolus]|nr:hypothetical protein HDU82_005120 [Entophlyctis luteolus]
MKLWANVAGKLGRQNFPEWIESWGQKPFYNTGYVLTALTASSFFVPGLVYSPWIASGLVSLYWYVGITDMRQVRHAVRRNYPVLGNIRYILENIAPELHQYIVEGPLEGVPYTKEERSMAYRRSKPHTNHSMPFGTRLDVSQPGYQWVHHSLYPVTVPEEAERVVIGGPACLQRYSASRLNISGMSYGALSSRAIVALNMGARMGHFYHNTGEGGLSTHHLEHGGDLVWNVGTGYFGCRTMDGKFDAAAFAERAILPQVKMIELKLSQGAKPGHGGMLPADKITPEISSMRIVPMGQDCISPPAHTACPPTATGLLEFVQKLRNLSGAKPVGIKLCVGRPDELAELVAAMVQTGIKPDFITVDGSEGGTGAAPIEFSDSVGMPMMEGLTLVNGLLRGAGIRGITSSDPKLVQGLDILDKSKRVYRFHNSTLHMAMELIGAMGLDSPAKLEPRHIMKRVSVSHVASFEELYPSVEPGSLLAGSAPNHFQKLWDDAVAKLKRGG